MTGILGGTFDPPHNGHVALAKAALEQLPIDELVVLVIEHPGHRGVIADPQTRLRISPLNVVKGPYTAPPEVGDLITVEREASTEAFHLSMLIAAGLLAAGAITNAVGIVDSAAKKAGRGSD